MGALFSFKYIMDPEVYKTEEFYKAIAVEGGIPNKMMSLTQDRGAPSEDKKLFSSVVFNACTLPSL